MSWQANDWYQIRYGKSGPRTQVYVVSESRNGTYTWFQPIRLGMVREVSSLSSSPGTPPVANRSMRRRIPPRNRHCQTPHQWRRQMFGLHRS